jgi:hypothetical protein
LMSHNSGLSGGLSEVTEEVLELIVAILFI